MFDTHLTLIGQVASDVKFAVSNRPEGEEDLSIAKFRVATTSRKYDRSKAIWIDGDTIFATIVCFRRLAENVMSSFKRGDPIMVYGKMRTRQWQGDNSRGTELEIIAIAAGHNLQAGTAMFSKSLFRVPPDSAEASAESTGESAGSASEDLFSRAADVQAADTDPATTSVAAVTPLPGVSDIRSVGAVDAPGVSDIRSVGAADAPGVSDTPSVGAVDAPGVLPTRPREERTSPHPTSSTPSTPADEQAA